MHIRRYILGWTSCMYIIACAYTITCKTPETKSTCDQHVACVSLHVMIYLHLPSVSLHLVQLHWEKKISDRLTICHGEGRSKGYKENTEFCFSAEADFC